MSRKMLDSFPRNAAMRTMRQGGLLSHSSSIKICTNNTTKNQGWNLHGHISHVSRLPTRTKVVTDGQKCCHPKQAAVKTSLLVQDSQPHSIKKTRVRLRGLIVTCFKMDTRLQGGLLGQNHSFLSRCSNWLLAYYRLVSLRFF